MNKYINNNKRTGQHEGSVPHPLPPIPPRQDPRILCHLLQVPSQWEAMAANKTGAIQSSRWAFAWVVNEVSQGKEKDVPTRISLQGRAHYQLLCRWTKATG